MSQIEDDQKIKEIVKHMLHELETPSKELTSWEANFIESVTDQFERRGSLSPKQREIVERIYNEKTS